MSVAVEIKTVTYTDVRLAAQLCAERWHGRELTGVYGVPRGGAVPAVMVAQEMELPLLDELEVGCLVVDDLVDSGRTAARYLEAGFSFDALWRKTWSPPTSTTDYVPTCDDWIAFPWEMTDRAVPAEDNVVRLLEAIGEDPTRDGLLDTPARVVKALREMTTSEYETAAEVLGTTFDVGADELVVVSGIEFSSLCEHHLLPFIGTATVGYLPGDRVVGLSKLARLVDHFASRLQVQERMTSQIAEAIMDHLDAQAAGVIVQATHSCMACRGVRKQSTMTTSAMLGRLRDEPAMRAEFLAIS